MKNKILIYSILLTGFLFILTSSCNKDDFTNPKNLSGTTWKSQSNYYLKFASKTTYKFWEEEANTPEEEWLQWISNYSIIDNTIELLGENDYPYTGTIIDQTIKVFMFGEMEEFVKQ